MPTVTYVWLPGSTIPKDLFTLYSKWKMPPQVVIMRRLCVTHLCIRLTFHFSSIIGKWDFSQGKKMFLHNVVWSIKWDIILAQYILVLKERWSNSLCQKCGLSSQRIWIQIMTPQLSGARYVFLCGMLTLRILRGLIELCNSYNHTFSIHFSY